MGTCAAARDSQANYARIAEERNVSLGAGFIGPLIEIDPKAIRDHYLRPGPDRRVWPICAVSVESAVPPNGMFHA